MQSPFALRNLLKMKSSKEKFPQTARLYSDLVKISLSIIMIFYVCLAGHLVLQE